MEKIEFLDFIKVCTDFIKFPENEECLKAYTDMQSKLVVKAYMPMDEKVIALYKMVLDSDKSIDLPASVFTAGLELACLFDGLLAYTNIDVNIPASYKIYETYDAIYQSGMADYMLEFCHIDYDRLVRMMERTMSYGNLLELVDTMKNMDTREIQKLVAEVKKLKENIDPETIKNLTTIMQYSDPLMYQVKEEVVDMAMDSLDKIAENYKTKE